MAPLLTPSPTASPPVGSSNSSSSSFILTPIETSTSTVKIQITSTITPVSATATLVAQTSPTPTQNFPDLYIRQSGIDNDDSVHILAGINVKKYNVGDELVVYTTLATGVEFPIALVRVFGKSPTTLLAQTILFDPNYPIQPNLRLDDQVDQVSTAALEPMPFIPADGYLLREGSIYILHGVTLTVGSTLQALMLVEASPNSKIIDAIPFSQTIKMRITNIGQVHKIASVELVEGNWPAAGTLLTVLPNSTGMPVNTPRPATETPILAPTATQAVTPTPKITTILPKVKPIIDVQGAGSVLEIDLLSPLTSDQK